MKTKNFLQKSRKPAAMISMLAIVIQSLAVSFAFSSPLPAKADSICSPDDPKSWHTADLFNTGSLVEMVFHDAMNWFSDPGNGSYGGRDGGGDIAMVRGGRDCGTETGSATFVMHNDPASRIAIRHLDGRSGKDSFEVRVNGSLVGTYHDDGLDQEIWKTTVFSLPTGLPDSITVEIISIDPVWDDCEAYGQIAINWVEIGNCEEQPSSKGSLTICKFEDKDMNGSKNEGDTPLAWPFTVKAPNNSTVQITTSAESGCATIEDLVLGAYEITEADDNDAGDLVTWTKSSPISGKQAIELAAGGNNATFLNYRNAAEDKGSITICKYNDEDGDGLLDENETTAGAGWEFVVLGTGNAVTGENGCAVVSGLSYGAYNITETPKANWHQTFPLQSSVTVEINTESKHRNIDFYNHFSENGGGICGNGVVDPGEQCDDNNSVSGDGCSSQCMTEGGSGEIPFCGDSRINQSSEECDDGNTTAGDGCSSGCRLESSNNSSGSTSSSSGGGGTPLCILDGSCGGAVGFASSESTPEEKPDVLGEEGAPQLAIQKSAKEEFINPGGSVTYSVTVTNNGKLTAFKAVLEDTLPQGLAFEDGKSTKKWELGDIAPGASKSISYKAFADKDMVKGKYKNIAKVSAENNEPVTANADIDIRIPEVLGAELPATGFSWAELAALLALAAAFFYGASSLKRNTRQINTK